MKTGLPIAHRWPKIRRIVERGQRSTLRCAIASVDPDGLPDVIPVGTVFLHADQTGFYFDRSLARWHATSTPVWTSA